MTYDVVIQSGEVLDGESESSAMLDIGIKDGKIAAMSANISAARAAKIIDATGYYVTPGFIDLTNHSDTHLTLFRYPHLESMVMQGVTTIVGGNCGASLAPLASARAIHAIDKWADPSLININWNTTAEYLNEVSKLRLGVNYITFAGYGTLRRGVIDDAIRPLTPEECQKIKYLLSQSISEGARGLSLGLAYGHERVSPSDEIIEVCRALKGTNGILKIHLKSEGSEILSAINEVIRLGRESGISIEISHLKAIGKKSWPLLPKALDMIARARSAGLNIHFDVSPYNATGSLLYLLMPAWARHGGLAELFKKIDDAGFYEKIVNDLRRQTFHFDRILLTRAEMPGVVGKTILEIAENMGIPPEEALVKLVRANEGRVAIVGRTLSRQNMERAIVHEASFIASDGEGYDQREQENGNLAHPRSFGAFPHFWHFFVSDFKKINPHEAIKKITSGPAAKIGLKKRGALKVGYAADIAVFDPRLFRDRALYRNPFRYPSGMSYVLINGAIHVAEGRHTGARAGEVIRG